MSLLMLFSLLKSQHIRDVDHALAISLQRLQPDTSELVCIAVALASKAHSLGHSCVPLDRINVLLNETSTGVAPPLPSADVFATALRSSDWVAMAQAGKDCVLVLQDNAIALRRYWSYEVRLAKALALRLTGEPEPVSDTTRQFWQALFSDDRDGRQAIAALRACETRFFLLTGGPGTGKTATIARVIQLLLHQAAGQSPPLRIALAAPTGKAAARLSEALQTFMATKGLYQGTGNEPALALTAQTVHRLLASKPDSVQFQHDAEHRLPLDVLIVDEASMIDLPLMCKMLEALPDAARLILVGDPDQLPSVETGDVLRACCEAIGGPGEGARHRVQLDRVYRQNANLDIGLAAQTVLSGDDELFIEGLEQGKYRGMDWQTLSQPSLEKTIHSIALSHYQKIQKAQSLEQALALSKQFKVLCAARETSAGCIAINQYIAERLRKWSGAIFYPGRLCLVTENNIREKLFNGDIGLCWPDEQGVLRVWVETSEGLKAWHPANFPSHEDAFAITIHKAQGSEFERILLVLPDAHHRVLSRELLYTGITRARGHIDLCASRASLSAAIFRQNRRWSGLAARLAFHSP